MIVDTSALVAVALREAGHLDLRTAMVSGEALIPALVIVEYERVVTQRGSRPNPDAQALPSVLIARGVRVAPFDAGDASSATGANAENGEGNGRGGSLNLLDLMVFGMAQRLGLPILCTGRDFAKAGADIHPASRLDDA